jgi:hypothetical protein
MSIQNDLKDFFYFHEMYLSNRGPGNSVGIGFKPGRSRRNFSGKKIVSMPSFGREVKPFVIMSQICGMLKNPVIAWKLGHRKN